MDNQNERNRKSAVFISYAREDKDFVHDLVDKLKEHGIEAKGDSLLTPGD